jgi:hypothetical protein
MNAIRMRIGKGEKKVGPVDPPTQPPPSLVMLQLGGKSNGRTKINPWRVAWWCMKATRIQYVCSHTHEHETHMELARS